MRTVFMGTPDFAACTLQAMIEAGHEVMAVVTQPDRPQGRKMELKASPVKETALKYNIPVYQPEKIRKSDMPELLQKLNPDVIVVVAFGQILTKEILDIPRYGCINVHASILPKYRGAAPIQWAVIDGEEYSGVTTMKMDEGIDTGDILMIEKYKLAPDETGGSLFDRLAGMGAKLLVRTLEGLEKGTVTPSKQEGTASYAGKLDKSTGLIDFTKSAAEIERLVRGLSPWPSAYSYIDGKTVKIWKSHVENTDCSRYAPGTVYAVDNAIHVSTGDGGLVITELQLESKKRMDSEAFLRGYHLNAGARLG